MKIFLASLVFQGIFTLISTNCFGANLCSPQLITTAMSSKEIIQLCQQESRLQNYFQLSQWIKESEELCKVNSPYKEPHYYSQCLSKVLSTANEVLICEQNPSRLEETITYDQELVAKHLKEYKPVITPTNIQKIFDRLTMTMDQNYTYDFVKPKWRLIVYAAKFRNASAAADGTVLLSENFWQGENKFSDKEVAAILAHELAHVQRRHFHKIGCVALEWMGTNVSIKEALISMREDMTPYMSRGQTWSETSQKFEFEADLMATAVLEKAGLHPKLMAKVLMKLQPKNPSAFSSGSHPEFEERIKRVL